MKPSIKYKVYSVINMSMPWNKVTMKSNSACEYVYIILYHPGSLVKLLGGLTWLVTTNSRSTVELEYWKFSTKQTVKLQTCVSENTDENKMMLS